MENQWKTNGKPTEIHGNMMFFHGFPTWPIRLLKLMTWIAPQHPTHPRAWTSVRPPTFGAYLASQTDQKPYAIGKGTWNGMKLTYMGIYLMVYPAWSTFRERTGKIHREWENSLYNHVYGHVQ